MNSSSETQKVDESPVVEISASSQSLSLKDQAGDVANRWLDKNRSLVLRQTPFWAQSLTALLIGLGAIVVAGGILFRIDEVVSVAGQLKSIGGNVEVKTPAGGRIAQILFEDGEFVQKGDLLLRFDTRQATAEKETLTSQIEIENRQLNAQLGVIESQQTTLDGRLSVLKERLDTKISILSEMEELVKQGGFQKIQYLEQKDQVFAMRQQLADIEEQKNRLMLEKERNILQSKRSISQMNTQLKRSNLQLQYQNVLAPVSGIIFDPQATLEGVIPAGQRILSIVPQNGLYAEVFVPNRDIGFVKTGQDAKVRVDAFPFSRYGEIPAKVVRIGADALEPTPENNTYRFPVKLDLERSNLISKDTVIPLKSGMAVTTNLKLRDKMVISLISDIFVDQTDSIRSLRQQ